MQQRWDSCEDLNDVALRDIVRSCKTRKALTVESLPLRITWYQLLWFGHVLEFATKDWRNSPIQGLHPRKCGPPFNQGPVFDSITELVWFRLVKTSGAIRAYWKLWGISCPSIELLPSWRSCKKNGCENELKMNKSLENTAWKLERETYACV